MSSASKQHRQVPKRIFPPVYLWHSTELFLWKCFLKKTQTTLRGCIYFWMGVLFPFVPDMRHKLLNLSSVRHRTNLQFTSKEFSVGWNCRVTQKRGKSSVNWYTAMCWVSHEMAACLGMLKKGFVFLFRSKTCPSHQKTCHGPRLPRASTGVQWYTLINACNHNIIWSMSKLCFYTKLKRIPSRP